MQNKEKYENKGGFNMCQAIREMMEDDWNEGERAGIQTGIASGMARAVLGLLGTRWKVSEELKARIMEEKDIEVLSRWNILAAKAESIEAFERQMGA